MLYIHLLLLQKYKIRGAQVTIDGPKDVHDSRRISCNGKSTFDLLINNVNKLLNNDHIIKRFFNLHTSCFLSKYHSPIFPSIRLRS